MSNNKDLDFLHAADEADFSHEYMHEHGISHEHMHEHTVSDVPEHSHTDFSQEHSNIDAPCHIPCHPHHHTNTKQVINRMSKAIGHMEAIKRMIEDERDCSEVLIQIAAVRSAINNVGKIILEDHINHCVVDAVETGDQQVLDDLLDAINKFIK